MINQIKEALEQATDKGKWVHNGNEFVSEFNARLGIGGFMTEADNHLVQLLVRNAQYLLDELEKAQKEAEHQYKLFNAELDITRKLREALEEADVFDPTRHRFKMDANGNLTPIEDTP